MKSMISVAAALSVAGGLSFAIPSGNTTDIPNLYCAQVDRDSRTWIICTEDELGADDVDAIIEHGERIRQGKKEKHSPEPEGKPL
jgi:hypothetical protein